MSSCLNTLRLYMSNFNCKVKYIGFVPGFCICNYVSYLTVIYLLHFYFIDILSYWQDNMFGNGSIKSCKYVQKCNFQIMKMLLPLIC